MAKLIDLINKNEYEIGKTPIIANILYLGCAGEKRYELFPHLIDKGNVDYRWNIINPSNMAVMIEWKKTITGRPENKKQHIKGSAPSFHLLDGDIIRIDHVDMGEGLWKYNFLYKNNF